MLVVEQLKPKRHARDGFTCGEHALDAYLHQQAAQHHRDGISTTHILADDADPTRILGYYSLSAAHLLLTDLQEVDRQRLPNYPVPAIRMGRLAVSASEQGRGMVITCLRMPWRAAWGCASSSVCACSWWMRCMKAARFYRAYGFREATANSHTLYLPLGNS